MVGVARRSKKFRLVHFRSYLQWAKADKETEKRRTKDKGLTDRDTLHHLTSGQRERERERERERRGGQDEDEPAVSRENKMISLPKRARRQTVSWASFGINPSLCLIHLWHLFPPYAFFPAQ